MKLHFKVFLSSPNSYYSILMYYGIPPGLNRDTDLQFRRVLFLAIFYQNPNSVCGKGHFVIPSLILISAALVLILFQLLTIWDEIQRFQLRIYFLIVQTILRVLKECTNNIIDKKSLSFTFFKVNNVSAAYKIKLQTYFEISLV